MLSNCLLNLEPIQMWIGSSFFIWYLNMLKRFSNHQKWFEIPSYHTSFGVVDLMCFMQEGFCFTCCVFSFMCEFGLGFLHYYGWDIFWFGWDALILKDGGKMLCYLSFLVYNNMCRCRYGGTQ
jgi:hypothetical protein